MGTVQWRAWVTRAAALAAVVLVGGGCYHAVVETGRPAGGTVVENKWAHSFLYGLVPPSEVNVAQQCGSGVSRVETQHSFLNMVANAVTFGIYSPMTIRVTCASGDDTDGAEAPQVRVPAGADAGQLSGALARAAMLASQGHGTAYLVVDPE